ncbi:hypothetical protein L484_007376 [Morus notabilis]|uniref:Uncharacterized protein n=1 Tax=Morus notabilis TaxID=981085 RepID=W9SBV5_9ROSA|nr:hypothetical protein L484_007376 [Morus notabilis]
MRRRNNFAREEVIVQGSDSGEVEEGVAAESDEEGGARSRRGKMKMGNRRKGGVEGDRRRGCSRQLEKGRGVGRENENGKLKMMLNHFQFC